jgi:hypothetical protein
MKKKYLKNLILLRKKIEHYKSISADNINDLLKIRKKLQKKETMSSKLCSIEKLTQWKLTNGKLKHYSNQFFSVEGVKVKNANREVKNWEQLIFNQPHGGVLAFLVRETKNKGIEFLLHLRSEPGDKNIKFCTQCQHEVHFCATDDELVDAIQRNKCIAIYNPYNICESEMILGMPEKK